jgi:hypothetical protein
MAEKMYYNDGFAKIQGDVKKTWGLIKTVINNNEAISCSIKEIKNDDVIMVNAQDIANKLNEYFVNIGPNLAKKIPVVGGNHCDFIKNLS